VQVSGIQATAFCSLNVMNEGMEASIAIRHTYRHGLAFQTLWFIDWYQTLAPVPLDWNIPRLSLDSRGKPYELLRGGHCFAPSVFAAGDFFWCIRQSPAPMAPWPHGPVARQRRHPKGWCCPLTPAGADK